MLLSLSWSLLLRAWDELVGLLLFVVALVLVLVLVPFLPRSVLVFCLFLAAGQLLVLLVLVVLRLLLLL